jgi:hypothetical protein
LTGLAEIRRTTDGRKTGPLFACAPWVLAAFCLVVFVGPLTSILSNAGRLDRQDLYIVLSFGVSDRFQEQLDLAGGREVGPVRPLFSQFVTVAPAGHARLMMAGYRLLPAGLLADICGVSGDVSLPMVRNS